MSVQIRPSVTNPTLASLYKEISDGLLVLAPDFQRRFVWTQSHQEEFLDTIILGLPFPEIYVSTGQVDIERMRTTRNVIDGQQRLTTIRNYIDGTARTYSKLPAYKDLTPETKGAFLSYEVVVRDLGKIPDETVREIFRRINLTKFKLDSVEIHNAVYDGAFISTAKRVVDEVDLEIFGVFRESEFSRMSDLHFVLNVMATLESGGYFLQDAPVEKFIEQYNDEYSNADRMFVLLTQTFEVVRDLNLPPDSMWYRKANFFTLIVEVTKGTGALPLDLKDKLLDLEARVMENKLKPDNKFGKYYSYMYQNTTGRIARVTRGDLFREFVLTRHPE
ncbi:MAG: DUF262 domain-containing protein [Rhodobacteraceae bacterium]|nr:DUF262 domain-containing protein [Paracoccaceae bacterium]